MKLKQRPEDFEVEELTDVMPDAGGPFAFYRLDKSGWTTPDALAAIQRRWRLNRRRISCGGLKDRHANTVQYLTIFRGPQRNLTHQRIALTYLGQTTQAYGAGSFRGNRFRITLRSMTPAAIGTAQGALEQVRSQGVPNYFDDQRFGSVSVPGEFMARSLLGRSYEEALRRALLTPYEFDRAAQKQEKASLHAHWGDWAKAKELLPRGHARSLVDYLVHHPTDFRGAVERIRPDLRGLYLSAYQSYLWNRLLGNWLQRRLSSEQLLSIHLRLGDFPVHRGLTADELAELATLKLPLPSGRMELGEADPRKEVVEAVLQEEGVTPEQFKLRGLREMFFSRGERAALCMPANLQYEVGPDELNPNKQKLIFACELPRGCYATLIVKRLTAANMKQSP